MTELPVYPREALDTSVLQTHQRCPRKALYQYLLNRTPSGKNWPIGFGLAYHKFREVLEKSYMIECVEKGTPLGKAGPHLYALALTEATKDYEDPPIGDSKEYLTKGRLELTCEQAFHNWLEEKRAGLFKVLEAEQAFMLELPNGELFGGRFDQILEWRGKLWVKDFKTTSRMGKDYARMFDPNDQMTAYTWAASQLSGRPVQGVIIEVVYNTKTKGPEHHVFLSARTPFQIEEWQNDVMREIKEFRAHTTEKHWPKRTSACNDFGGCYYRECCAKSSWRMRDEWLRAKTIESSWDFMNPDQEEGVVD